MAPKPPGPPVSGPLAPPSGVPARRTRADGEASRRDILRTAARLVTTRGLEGLSIGELADAVGMSKSGLYAHFASKTELELEVIRTAAEIFQEDVLSKCLEAAPGVARLEALADAYLSHLERRVFPGGCFFAAAAAELDTRPGPARDQVVAMHAQWAALIERCFREAKEVGEVAPDADVAQCAFEAGAVLALANIDFLLSNDPKFLARGRAGVAHVVDRVRAPRRAAARTPRARRSG